MLSTGYCSNQYAISILDRLREKDRDTVPFDLTPNADRSPVVMPYSSPDTAAAANGLDRSPVVMPYSSPDTACVWRSLRPDQRRSELKMSHSDSIVQFRLNLYWAHHSYVSAPCKTFTYGL
jgi:hypothetical protein